MIDKKAFQRYAADPQAFRNDLIVDVDGVARRLGSVLDPWQRDDFAAMDPAWQRCMGLALKCNSPMRAYLERGRGHSKTTDLAVAATRALAFAKRPLRGYAFAADQDQSRLLLDAVQRLLRLNPWLAQILDAQKNRVVNIAKGHHGEGSTLEISPSDVGSSYGILPDFVIADELTHWPDNASELWESLVSSVAKRTNCVFVVISNAGYCETWQWNLREAIRTDAGWYFSRLEGPVASWLNDKRLEEQRKLLPPVAFERLWGNQWSSGGGDALTKEVIEAAFKPDLKPFSHRQDGWDFVAGVDLGVVRDASAICILGVRKNAKCDKSHADHGRIRLVHCEVVRPQGKKVDLQRIEDTLASLHRIYKFRICNFDPWQAVHLAQRLVLCGLPMNEVAPTGKNLQAQATAVIESFNDRRVDLYEQADLRRDLTRMRVEEKSYGFRLTSPRDSLGHGDLGSAFALALLAASEHAGEPRLQAGVITVSDPAVGFAKRQADYEKEMTRLASWTHADESREVLSGMLRRMGKYW